MSSTRERELGSFSRVSDVFTKKGTVQIQSACTHDRKQGASGGKTKARSRTNKQKKACGQFGAQAYDSTVRPHPSPSAFIHRTIHTMSLLFMSRSSGRMTRVGLRGDILGSVASCPGLRVQYW